jgi:hypothetical protein
MVTYLFFVGQILSVCDQSSQQLGHAQPVKRHTARVNLKIWRKILRKNAYCHHLLKTDAFKNSGSLVCLPGSVCGPIQSSKAQASQSLQL